MPQTENQELSLGVPCLDWVLEPNTPDRLERETSLRRKLTAANLAMLKQRYYTLDQRTAEAKRLSLTSKHANESANARHGVLALLYGDREALNEYLAYLCGDDLLAWAKLLQIFTPRGQS